MKKLLFVFPVVALLATGCNSSQTAYKQVPVQNLVAQNTNPTFIPAQTPSTTPTTDQTANWQSYTNSELGFQFKYPPTFTIGDIRKGKDAAAARYNGIFFISINSSSVDISKVGSLNANGQGFSFQVYSDKVPKDSNGQVNLCKQNTSTYICTKKTINGQQAFVITFEYTEGEAAGMGVKERDVYFVKGSNYYQFYVGINGKDISTLANQVFDIDKVAGTFQFIQNSDSIKNLPKDQCPCWDGQNNICLPQTACE